jgi:hypothetical protein
VDTYLVRIRNPAGNPSAHEEEYIDAENDEAALAEARRLVAEHPFCDVSLESVTRVDTGDLYHETTAS